MRVMFLVKNENRLEKIKRFLYHLVSFGEYFFHFPEPGNFMTCGGFYEY